MRQNPESQRSVPQGQHLEATPGGLEASNHRNDQRRSQFTSQGRAQSTGSARRINPDSIKMLWFVVAGVIGLGCISFMVSFAGLVAVAEWAGIPRGLRWAVPVFIDAAILIYALAILIHRARGEATWASWLTLSTFSVISVLANIGHVLLMPGHGGFQQWIGAAVAGMAPVGVFAATEELGRLAIERPGHKNEVSEELVQVGDDRPNPTPPTTPQGPGPRELEDTVRTEEDTNDTTLDTNPDMPPAVADTESEELVGASNSTTPVQEPAATIPAEPASTPLFSQVSQPDTAMSEPADTAEEPVAEHVADTTPAEEAATPTWDMISVPKPLSELRSGQIPVVAPASAPVRDTTTASPVHEDTVSETTEPVQEDKPAAAAAVSESGHAALPSMRVIHSLDPAEQEDRIIEGLLAEHGKDLTAKMIADALGKVPRTGQRKLVALKKKHPEIFGAETTASKEA
ncbi:DUF2637 domain-containing protein [Glutamicibacter sp. AOP5-A2-18]|uniref:DUF2637 domain-containing protein n=1 Tax=Glutamicibacter sp. AOP5-A2-18 TaxID=3457656 RepID=UPI004033D072